MGTHVVRVPDVGEGIAEVELVQWVVGVGDTVTRNQVLAEVMTDKANVEIPSPVDGVIANLTGDVGGTLAVGSTLIELTVEGEGTSANMARPAAVAAPAATPAPPPPGPASSAPPSSAPPSSGPASSAQPPATETVVPGRARVDAGPPRPEGEAPRASPAVRHRARQAGIDLRRVSGSGPAGRITHDDLDGYLSSSPRGLAAGGAFTSGLRRPATEVVTEPIIGMRRRIAERMVASTQTIPHITYVEEVDVTALEELRATLNERRTEQQERLTLLPFLARAIVGGVAEFPQMNAHVDDDPSASTSQLKTFAGVHIGIATQTVNGLVVPVLRHAEAQSIWSLAAEIAALAGRAREGGAAPSELSGSTITISSLGALGGLVTTPVINKPEVAIIGVNKIVTRPVWQDGAFVPRQIMNLSSSFDHRIIDGFDAASFVQTLRRSLEQPALLFLDGGA